MSRLLDEEELLDPSDEGADPQQFAAFSGGLAGSEDYPINPDSLGGAEGAMAGLIPRQPAATDTSSLLRGYYGTDPQYQKLADTAAQQKLFSQLGEAGDTVGHALAKSTTPVDSSFYRNLETQADQPLKDYASSRALLSKYLTSKYGVDTRAQTAKNLQDVNTQLAGTRSQDYNKRTDAIVKNADARVKLAGEGLDLRKGAQAAQAATKFNSDPVIKTSNTQLAQIQKGLGRLDDVDSGRVPFSTTIKADIEKDIANVISGGTSSSLGQLHRVEFQPYVAGWQKMVDEINGYQGDINAPEFRQQLRAQLEGLRDDITAIQGSRSGQLHKSLKTAYSKNALASQALDENKTLYSQPPPGKTGGKSDHPPGWSDEKEKRMKELEALEAGGKAK